MTHRPPESPVNGPPQSQPPVRPGRLPPRTPLMGDCVPTRTVQCRKTLDGDLCSFKKSCETKWVLYSSLEVVCVRMCSFWYLTLKAVDTIGN